MTRRYLSLAPEQWLDGFTPHWGSWERLGHPGAGFYWGTDPDGPTAVNTSLVTGAGYNQSTGKLDIRHIDGTVTSIWPTEPFWFSSSALALPDDGNGVNEVLHDELFGGSGLRAAELFRSLEDLTEGSA